MAIDQTKSIGLLIGREWSWPSAFIAEVNRRDEGVVAEFVKIGETTLESPCPYDVIIDRMSHEIPYYRTYLKHAAISGCYIINDPFMSAADDKFFGIALVRRLGVRTPHSVALPNKRIDTENVPESFRNLVYPMDWQGIIDYVGVPAILKDVLTGGRRVAQRVHNVDELIQRYDESDTLTMVLQEIVETDYHLHCFVVGREQVLSARYSLEDGRYLAELTGIADGLRQAAEYGALAVTRAYGYDINMVEYVIKSERPYLINPTNPTPDLDIHLLTAEHFNWCVNRMADLAIKIAKEPPPQFEASEWHKVIAAR